MKKSSINRTNRRVAAQSRRKIIGVFCEGQVTEPEYLRLLAKDNCNVGLKIKKCGKSPEKLLQEAQKFDISNKRIREVDEIWCIFDVDHHTIQQVAEIRRSANKDNVQMVVSNPCFELWLVLHKEEQTACITSKKIKRRAEDLKMIDGKAIAATRWPCLFDKYEDAKARAIDLDKMHQRKVSQPGSNPSTDIWKLVDILRS